MAYATQGELERLIAPAVLVQLADDNADGVADATVVAEALEWADDQINAYCGSRYQVPFTTVPGVINKTAVDLALYHLYTRRSSADVPPIRKERYEAAIRFLERAADGKVSLGVQPAPAEDEASQDSPKTTVDADAGEDRIFTIRKDSTGKAGTLDHF